MTSQQQELDNMMIEIIDKGLIVIENQPNTLSKKSIIHMLKYLDKITQKIQKQNPHARLMIIDDAKTEDIIDITACNMWSEIKQYLLECMQRNQANFMSKSTFSVRDMILPEEWKTMLIKLDQIFTMYGAITKTIHDPTITS